jgi:two-component system chemotaxis response regulator CheY
MEMLLKRAGYTVTKSESAEAAMTALESISPKLIITDLNMPGMNGIELINLDLLPC